MYSQMGGFSKVILAVLEHSGPGHVFPQTHACNINCSHYVFVSALVCTCVCVCVCVCVFGGLWLGVVVGGGGGWGEGGRFR